MTRINVIPVQYLADQHLIAEYRELPRVLKQNIDLSDAPDNYCLGKGHMKWGRKHALYCLKRYKEICNEMIYRGFTVNYTYEDLKKYVNINCPKEILNDYIITDVDIVLNLKRIVEKIIKRQNFYKWTNRYFCGTTGEISEKTLRHYIENQD